MSKKYVPLPFNPTYQQCKIIKADELNKSFIIKASAGTGKSTTLRFIGQFNKDKKYIYIVFNRANAIEAAADFPPNVFCTTANSLGFRAVIGKDPIKRNRVKSSMTVHTMQNVTGAYKEFNSLSPDQRAILVINIIKTVENFCKTLDLEITFKHVPMNCADALVNRVIGYAKVYWEKAKEVKCDITHDVYMKIWSLRNPKLLYDTILYDEAQDANALMVQLINQQKASIIAVGDHYQSIYKFAGAVNALSSFKCDAEFELTQSYRYGPKIAELANKILYNNFGVNNKIKGFEELDTKISYGLNQKQPRAIIARTNIKLLDLMLEAAEDQKNYIAYLDTKELRNIIFSLSNLRFNKGEVFHPELSGFEDWDEFMVFLQNGGSPKLLSIVQMWGSKGGPAINNALRIAEENELKLKNRLNTDLDFIFISGHKSKGLEFNQVSICDDFIDPEDQDKYSDEETNLLYVASTRSKKALDISENPQLMKIHNSKIPK